MNSLSGPSEEMGSTGQQTRLTDNIVNYLTLRNGVIVLIVLIIYLVIEANIPDIAPGVVKFSIRGVVVAGALIIYLSEAPNWDDLFVYFKWFAIAFFLVAFLFSLEVCRTGDPNANPFQNVYNHMVNGWGSDSAKTKKGAQKVVWSKTYTDADADKDGVITILRHDEVDVEPGDVLIVEVDAPRNAEKSCIASNGKWLSIPRGGEGKLFFDQDPKRGDYFESAWVDKGKGVKLNVKLVRIIKKPPNYNLLSQR